MTTFLSWDGSTATDNVLLKVGELDCSMVSVKVSPRTFSFDATQILAWASVWNIVRQLVERLFV